MRSARSGLWGDGGGVRPSPQPLGILGVGTSVCPSESPSYEAEGTRHPEPRATQQSPGSKAVRLAPVLGRSVSRSRSGLGHGPEVWEVPCHMRL